MTPKPKIGAPLGGAPIFIRKVAAAREKSEKKRFKTL